MNIKEEIPKIKYLNLSKFKMNKNYRLLIISILLIVAFFLSFLIYQEKSNYVVKENKFTLYNYNQKLDVGYNVHVKPNMLYDDKILGEGQSYITEYVDNIMLKINYGYNGDKIADISGDYEVVALMEGYTGEKENFKSIWKKQFIFLPKTQFKVHDKKLSLSKNIPINYQRYNQFAKKIIDSSKIDSMVKLVINVNYNIKADTNKGIIKEKANSGIIIPLKTSFFEILTNKYDIKHGTIENTEKIKTLSNSRVIFVYKMLIGVFILGILFFIVFTSEDNEKDPLIKNLHRIFKNHGDRLVAVNNDITLDGLNIQYVNSIGDLVRVADEIQKPIIYKISTDYKTIFRFYVLDDKVIYVLNLMGENLLREN